MHGKRRTLNAIALIAFAVAAGAGTLQAQAKQGQGRASVDPLASRSKGSASAPVTVYEMSDFQCPFCRRFALETFPSIDREYISTGKVRWIFINFPLTSIHANAVPAAELALCAAQQNAFWPVHDLLYQHQAAWSKLKDAEPFLLDLADSAKIDRKKTLACLQNPETRKAIQADAEGSARSGAQSTPAFYIEGGLLLGAQPIGVFRQVLDSIYATKNAARAKSVPPPAKRGR